MYFSINMAYTPEKIKYFPPICPKAQSQIRKHRNPLPSDYRGTVFRTKTEWGIKALEGHTTNFIILFFFTKYTLCVLGMKAIPRKK
jgi:hypothetical protein